MDNRYFWIKDRLESENIEVEYCPIEKMLVDFFTKALQGNLSCKFRDVVLGYKHINSLDMTNEESSSQERVSSENMMAENIKGSDNGPSVVRTKKSLTWVDIVKGK